MPLISSAFDSGSINVIKADTVDDIRLAICQDNAAEFSQWFHFRLQGARAQACKISIVNAGSTTYPQGWDGYSVVCSYDRAHWFRIPTHYDGDVMSWTITAAYDAMYFAYFAPYSLEQHADLVASSACEPGVELQRLAETIDGRDLDCLHINPVPGDVTRSESVDQRFQVWAIARQHPGESMAEWWMQGWLGRLLDVNDATARGLRQLADIHVVPNMNPDGSYRGNLRTNSVGANLNREWQEPSQARSPEVLHVRQQMHRTGVNISLDIHGDEALPYNFIAGTEGIPSWNDKRDAELIAFKRTVATLNPDFQTTHGYPRNRPGSGNLTYCSNYVGEAFGCLAVTLEMPFKDTADTPRPEVGWSPERAQRLGETFVEAVYMALTDRLL